MLGKEGGILLGVKLGTEDGFEEPLYVHKKQLEMGQAPRRALMSTAGCRHWLRRLL
jgi:hypothetical protein